MPRNRRELPTFLSLTQASPSPAMPRAEKRSQGSYYTRGDVAAVLVRKTLSYLPSETTLPKVLDPACGAGVLLVEAFLQLLERLGTRPTLEARLQIAKQCLFGIDQSPFAISAAKLTLASAILGNEFSADSAREVSQLLGQNLRCGDALIDPTEAMTELVDDEEGLTSLQPVLFDVILSNPPYKNIRQIAKTHGPQMQKHLRKRYRCAQGSFDLYMLFVERAFELLAERGVAGVIIPNRWTTAQYAKPGRELLLAQTELREVIDLSSLALFEQADVYPQMVLFQKQMPGESSGVLFQTVTDLKQLESDVQRTSLVPQRELSAQRITFAENNSAIGPLMDRRGTKPLGKCCKIVSGMSGFASQKLLSAVKEASRTVEESESLRPLVVSGNLDRYQIHQGSVRYLKHDFQRPLVDLTHAGISAQKRKLFERPKLLVAGLSKCLEVAYDQEGLALGVQVFALLDWQVDPFWLLAVLNSRLITLWYREQFVGKQLSCGYVPVNKGQLAEIPLPILSADSSEEEQAVHQQLAALGWRRNHESPLSPAATMLDQQIDLLVEGLYQITAEESQQLQTTHQALLATLRAKAA